MEAISKAEIARHYKAMLDSVAVIHGVLDGTQMADSTDAERADALRRNVEHLEIMMGQDFWTDEDMAPVLTAISAGTL